MDQDLAAIAATLCILALYVVAAFAVRHRWSGTLLVHPLKVTAHIRGRASLSRTQVFFFTFIFIWITIYWLLREGELATINDTVLALLGIAVAGAGLGRVATPLDFVSAERIGRGRGQRDGFLKIFPGLYIVIRPTKRSGPRRS